MVKLITNERLDGFNYWLNVYASKRLMLILNNWIIMEHEQKTVN